MTPPGESPEVSVVMGVRDAGAALARTVESVLQQSDIRLELIVVDDGSTDGAVAALRVQWRDDSRLRILEQAGRGLTTALIAGCRAARAPLIARQDAGDRSLPGRFVRQLQMLADRPGAVVVACGHRLVGPGGELLAAWPGPEGLVDTADPLLVGHSPRHGTVMFRREAYERAGGYRNEFYFAQDLDLWVRLVRLGSLVYAPEVLYEATYDYESITARHRDKQRALRSLIRRIHDVDKVGGDSSALLAQAARVRPDNVRRTGDRARAAYFIGSCLAARRDNRALAYLQEALRIRPFFVRGWLRLIRAHWQLR